jgi:hypothetical protein
LPDARRIPLQTCPLQGYPNIGFELILEMEPPFAFAWLRPVQTAMRVCNGKAETLT